ACALRRSPRTTPFTYTTLFRSRRMGRHDRARRRDGDAQAVELGAVVRRGAGDSRRAERARAHVRPGALLLLAVRARAGREAPGGGRGVGSGRAQPLLARTAVR